MGALNLPSAADIERLTRRLRSLSQRLEGIEDGVSRFDRSTAQRLSAIEDQLGAIAAKVQELSADGARAKRTGAQTAARDARSATSSRSRAAAGASKPPAAGRGSASKPKT